MKQLTKAQKEFMLYNFFYSDYARGWKNIAESLLDTGECIVAGKKCVWQGGIGNFIETEKDPELIDCLRYKFDVKKFMSKDNKYFMEYYDRWLNKIKKDKEKAEEDLRTITNSVTELENLI